MSSRFRKNAAFSMALLWIYSILNGALLPATENEKSIDVSAFTIPPMAPKPISIASRPYRNKLWITRANDNDMGDQQGEDRPFPTPTTTASSTIIANSLHGRLLCASTCAYYDSKDLQNNRYFRGAGFLPGTSLKRLAPRSGLDACLIGRTADGIVVAFRGTSGNALEWLQNASIYLR